MAANDLIQVNGEGSLDFGNYHLKEKTKLEDYPFGGDLYKVKTYETLTKLERNGLFLYESEPGTAVKNWKEDASGVNFVVSGKEDAQITIGLTEDAEYEVKVQGESAGIMKTNLSGKLSVSVELADAGEVAVSITRVNG